MMIDRTKIWFFVVFFPILVYSFPLAAQTWSLARERDGIRVYTRQEAGKSLKAYKGIADIQAPADKIFSMLEDVYHTEWWDSNVSQIKILSYEKNRTARYYMVYDSPWPVADRDVYVDVTMTMDPVKNVYTVTAVPFPGEMPQNPGRVRIREYRQTWTVEAAGAERSHVVLEGYLDPAGNIPAWIGNMLIVESPYNSISGVKKWLENK